MSNSKAAPVKNVEEVIELIKANTVSADCGDLLIFNKSKKEIEEESFQVMGVMIVNNEIKTMDSLSEPGVLVGLLLRTLEIEYSFSLDKVTMADAEKLTSYMATVEDTAEDTDEEDTTSDGMDKLPAWLTEGDIEPTDPNAEPSLESCGNNTMVYQDALREFKDKAVLKQKAIDVEAALKQEELDAEKEAA